MRRVFRIVAKEFKEALPPTLFFLVAFHVAAFLRALTEESVGITPQASTMATIGALIVGKTILVMNKFPIANWFSDRPLIAGILWKTFVFSLVATLFQIVEELVPLISKYGSVRVAFDSLLGEVVWPRFWAGHLVLLLFLLIYSTAVELIRVFGAKQMRQLFLGTGRFRQAVANRR